MIQNRGKAFVTRWKWSSKSSVWYSNGFQWTYSMHISLQSMQNTMVLQNFIFRRRLFDNTDSLWRINELEVTSTTTIQGMLLGFVFEQMVELFSFLFLFLWKNFQPPLHSPSYIQSNLFNLTIHYMSLGTCAIPYLAFNAWKTILPDILVL